MPADLPTMHSSFGTRFDPVLWTKNIAAGRSYRVRPSGWAAFFEGFELGDLEERDGAAIAQIEAEAGDISLQTRVDGLVYAYRTLGHTIARLDPLADKLPKIRCSRCANSVSTTRPWNAGLVEVFPRRQKNDAARDDRKARVDICRHDRHRVHAHPEHAHPQLGAASARIAATKRETPQSVQVHLLRALLEAESFESFLHSRYVGQKRFSLQGADRSW